MPVKRTKALMAFVLFTTCSLLKKQLLCPKVGEYLNKPNGYQSCQSGFNFWKRNNRIVKESQPGDIILYDWTGNGTCDHTGIFVKWMDKAKTRLQAWEGNTAQGDDSDGGHVMLRERKRTLVK